MADTEAHREFIAKSKLFHGAPDGAIRMAAEAATIRHFPEDSTIFREDDPGEAVYLLTQGRSLKVCSLTKWFSSTSIAKS